MSVTVEAQLDREKMENVLEQQNITAPKLAAANRRFSILRQRRRTGEWLAERGIFVVSLLDRTRRAAAERAAYEAQYIRSETGVGAAGAVAH